MIEIISSAHQLVSIRQISATPMRVIAEGKNMITRVAPSAGVMNVENRLHQAAFFQPFPVWRNSSAWWRDALETALGITVGVTAPVELVMVNVLSIITPPWFRHIGIVGDDNLIINFTFCVSRCRGDFKTKIDIISLLATRTLEIISDSLTKPCRLYRGIRDFGMRSGFFADFEIFTRDGTHTALSYASPLWNCQLYHSVLPAAKGIACGTPLRCHQGRALQVCLVYPYSHPHSRQL